MLTSINLMALAVGVSIGLIYGGRYERVVSGAIIFVVFATNMLQRITLDYAPYELQIFVCFAFALTVAGVCLFKPSRWCIGMLAVAFFQVVWTAVYIIGVLDSPAFYLHVISGSSYVLIYFLIMSVWQRHFAPARELASLAGAAQPRSVPSTRVS